MRVKLRLPGAGDVHPHHQLPVERQQLVPELDLPAARRRTPLPHLRHPDAAHLHHGPLAALLLPPAPRLLAPLRVPEDGDVPEAEAELGRVPLSPLQADGPHLHVQPPLLRGVWGGPRARRPSLFLSLALHKVELDVGHQLVDGGQAEGGVPRAAAAAAAAAQAVALPVPPPRVLAAEQESHPYCWFCGNVYIEIKCLQIKSLMETLNVI